MPLRLALSYLLMHSAKPLESAKAALVLFQPVLRAGTKSHSEIGACGEQSIAR